MIYKIEDSQYGDVILLDEYNDKWSLVAAREGNDGKIYKTWIHHQGKNKTINEKASPLAVGRVSRDEMIDMLKFFLNQLITDKDGGVINTTNKPVDDIPF